MKHYDNYIFDLDGTLIDSTSLWSEIDRKFFLRRGMDIPPHYNEEIAHVGLDKAAYITRTKYFPNEKEEDIIVIKHIISLCRELDFSPLAEGAETKEQVTRLSELGCNTVQGYYFSKPIPVEEFEKYL